MKGRCLKAVAQISRLCNPPKIRQTEEVMKKTGHASDAVGADA